MEDTEPEGGEQRDEEPYDPGPDYEPRLEAKDRPEGAPRCFSDYNPQLHRCPPCPVQGECQTAYLEKGPGSRDIVPEHGSFLEVRRVSDLSTVEGRGKAGDRGFRTTCLQYASRSDLPDAAFRLLAYLLSHGDSDGGNAFPSTGMIHQELADARGWSSKAKLERNLALLEERGWLERIPFETATGRRTSSLLRFRIPPDRPGPHRGKEGALHWAKRKGDVPLDSA